MSDNINLAYTSAIQHAVLVSIRLRTDCHVVFLPPMDPMASLSSTVLTSLQRLNSLPQQEAYRPPRRFTRTTLNPPKSSSEPTPVLSSAHHGVLHHLPPRNQLELHNIPSEPFHPPLRTASGTSPSDLNNNTINIDSSPKGPHSQVLSSLPTPFPLPSGTLPITSSSSKNSVPTLNKNETVQPTLLHNQTSNNPSEMIVDDIFSSNALPAFDWDQFLVGDADRAAVEVATALDKGGLAATLQSSQPNTPASDFDGATPKSTESESSKGLDVSEFFSFDELDHFAAPAGITHDPSDLLSSFTASTPVVPDSSMAADPTMLSTFGSTLGNFGNLASLGSDAVSQLQLGNLLEQLTGTAPTPAPATLAPSGLSEVYASLGWPLTGPVKEESPAASSPALSSMAMKRKASDSSDDMSSAKRSRGRPASSTPVAKRPYRRQSKNGLSLSQLAAAAATGAPIIDEKRAMSPTPEVEDDDEAPVRLTATGKPSTARPKAVVPEKYMKNGEAQAITGMTTEQILSFPNWSTLMECVDEAHRAGAEVFGKMISENRDKAKWAAKKSRDERKAKVESLEGQVDDLQGKIAEMRGLLLGLVGRGLVSLADVETYI